MLNYLYSFYYDEDEKKNMSSQQQPPQSLIPEIIPTNNKLGAGRNLPLHLLLKNAKDNLKQVETDKKIKELNLLTNVLLTKHKLKKVITREPITYWPCTNALFIELRNTVKLI